MTQSKHTPTHTTLELPYPFYGYKSYRIEVINDKLKPLQRHIWTTQDGEIETQDWINGFYDTEEKLTSGHWRKVKWQTLPAKGDA